MSLFDLTKLPDEMRVEVQAALDGCDFPLDRCRKPYRGDQVLVECVPGYPLEGSWADQGYIKLNGDLTGQKLRRVFIHEVAHAVDRLGGLTDDQRRFIDVVLHTGKLDEHPWLSEDDHDHDRDDYQQRVGEAWTGMFIWAWSNERPGDQIEMFKPHLVNTDMARMLRAFITPELPPKPSLDAAKRHNIVEIWMKGGNQYEKAVPAPDWLSNKIEYAKTRGRRVILR